jgi:hypothetical protein
MESKVENSKFENVMYRCRQENYMEPPPGILVPEMENKTQCPQGIMYSFPVRLTRYRHEQLFDRSVYWTNKTKYLGVILEHKLTYRNHIQSILSKENLKSGQLYVPYLE